MVHLPFRKLQFAFGDLILLYLQFHILFNSGPSVVKFSKKNKLINGHELQASIKFLHSELSLKQYHPLQYTEVVRNILSLISQKCFLCSYNIIKKSTQ